MRLLLRTALLMGMLTGSAHAALEDSVWVYQLLNDNPDCVTIERRLAETPLRETVIVSIEGGGFVLDRPNGREQLRCTMAALHRSGHQVKLLLLQDTLYLADDREAVRRMRAVGAFAKQEGGLAGAVVDIEPYLDEEWKSGSAEARRAIAGRFLHLLRQLRNAARPARLEAAIPWWLSSTVEIPELRPEHLFKAADGFYVMLYGLGGDANDGLADRIVKRLPPHDPLLQRGRVYLTLATEYELSPEHLHQDLALLRQRYRGARGFAGVSVFHAGAASKGQ